MNMSALCLTAFAAPQLMGMIQKNKGLQKEALATFKKVTSLDPGDEEVDEQGCALLFVCN